MRIDPLRAGCLFFFILWSGCAGRAHDVLLGERIERIEEQQISYSRYSVAKVDQKQFMFVLLHPAGYSGEDYARKWISLLGKPENVLIAPDSRGSRVDPLEFQVDLNTLVLGQAKIFGISDQNIFLIGESNGSILGFRMVKQFPDLFRSAAMISGAIDQKVLEELIENASAIKTKILIVHGTEDPVFKIQQMKQNFQLLKNAGVNVELRVVPGMGHGSDIFTDEDVVGWFKTKITESSNLKE